MANQKVFDISSGSGYQIYMEYNDVNLRIGNVFFTIPAGRSAHVLLWDNGALVYDNIYGEGSHSENVPGNYRVVETVDPESGETYALRPLEIAWSFSEISP